MAAGVLAQEDRAPAGSETYFIPRSNPYPRTYSTEPRDYNLRWGKLTGRLYGSVQTEFNDNINLAEEGAESDISFAPLIGIGFLWPLSEKNVLEFDVGVGYRAYLDHSELNSVTVSPDSRLTYQIRVLKAQITIHDEFSVQADPLTRPELSGGGGVFNYRRFNNDAGFTASWEAIRDVTLVGGYSYIVDRSLSDEFEELDRDDHVAHLALYRPLGARVTLGLAGAWTITDFLENVQNDAVTFSIGPHLSVRWSEFLSSEAGVRFTTSEYDGTGSIQDSEDFSGITYYTGIRHRLNSRTTQSLRVSQSVNPGFGSNFTDIFGLQYGVSLKVLAPLTLNGTFVYENFSASGPGGEESSRYLWYLGTGFRLTSKWNLGLGYSLGIKDSEQPGRDYTQNRVTIDLTRHF
jgi:hypothetical protein